MTTLSVVVPMLNESSTIARTLVALRRGAPRAQIVVVDGGSADLSIDIAKPPYRHGRSGYFCATQDLRSYRRISRSRPVRGSGFCSADEARRACGVPALAGDHFFAALDKQWDCTHRDSDVVDTRALSARH